MQQIINDDKSVIQKQNVPDMFIPNWPECGIKAVWSQAIRVDAFRRHLPDEWGPNDKTERRFFYGILCAIAP